MKSIRALCAAATLTAVLLLSSPTAARAQSSGDLSAFAGRWQINLSKSIFNRYGPNGKNTVRAATFTFLFTAQGKDMQLDYYNQYPQPKASRSMLIVIDQKAHPCTGDCISVGTTAPGTNQQTYTYTLVDPHTVMRVTYVKGKLDEYLLYFVTPDGKTLMQVNWNPETPDWQNIAIFEKQP